ncbi:MAG TPA: FAD-binding oxidoreductase, partial [Nevskiaceae bacterium]|nr:FAD-binding oxidoreductase [Nevskiaceae bacterium]
LAGGATPDATGRQVVIALERMRAIRNVDAQNATLTVEAGCTLAQVQQAAAAAGLCFPLSLGAEGSCRIGGNLSTNAGGVAVLHYGTARALTLGLEVVLPDGRVWNGLRRLRKNNTGYDLRQLFIGAEGTLGIIAAAVLKLYPAPRDRAVAIARVPDLECVVRLLGFVRDQSGDRVTGFEYLSGAALRCCRDYSQCPEVPFADCQHAVLVELRSSAADSGLAAVLETSLAAAYGQGLIEDAVVANSGPQMDAFWQVREAHLMEALVRAGADISCDVSVPVSQVPAFIVAATRAVEALCRGLRVTPYGHIGDGNIHFDLVRPVAMADAEFLAHWDELTDAVYDVAVRLGGSFSAEHGIGQLKRRDMQAYVAPIELELMRTIKNALDPHNLMNPDKVIPAIDVPNASCAAVQPVVAGDGAA